MYKGNPNKDKSHYARCSTLLIRFRSRHIKRLVALFALLCVNIYFHVLTFGVKYGGASFVQARAFELPMTDRPFAMGVVSATCSLVLLFIAFFAEVKRPKLMIPFFLIAITATWLDLIHWAVGLVIVGFYITQIIDNQRFKWVRKQPGYPHFNERLDAQLKIRAAAEQQNKTANVQVTKSLAWDTYRPPDENTWDGDVLNLDAIARYIGYDDDAFPEETEEANVPDTEEAADEAPSGSEE